MLSSQMDSREKEILWKMQGDLDSLASLAAIELDYYLSKKKGELEGARRLAIKLSSSLEKSSGEPLSLSLLNPSTVIIINRAIADSRHFGEARAIKDVVELAREVLQRLTKVVEDPGRSSLRELKAMRDFCLMLSKWTSSYKPSVYERKPAPSFRG